MALTQPGITRSITDFLKPEESKIIDIDKESINYKIGTIDFIFGSAKQQFTEQFRISDQ